MPTTNILDIYIVKYQAGLLGTLYIGYYLTPEGEWTDSPVRGRNTEQFMRSIRGKSFHAREINPINGPPPIKDHYVGLEAMTDDEFRQLKEAIDKYSEKR